jgi:hypothetical protein
MTIWEKIQLLKPGGVVVLRENASGRIVIRRSGDGRLIWILRETETTSEVLYHERWPQEPRDRKTP